MKLRSDLVGADGKSGPNYRHRVGVVEFPIAESPLIGVFIGIFNCCSHISFSSLRAAEEGGQSFMENRGGVQWILRDD